MYKKYKRNAGIFFPFFFMDQAQITEIFNILVQKRK